MAVLKLLMLMLGGMVLGGLCALALYVLLMLLIMVTKKIIEEVRKK